MCIRDSNRNCAMLETLNKSTPKQSRSTRNTLFKSRSTKGIKSIKQARYELEIEQQRKKEESVKSKKRFKENIFLKNKTNRELVSLIAKHNPHDAPITFPMLCTLSSNFAGGILTDFGMLKSPKDENLVKCLHKLTSGSEEELKSAILMILNIDCESNVEMAASEMQRLFRPFCLNKILSAGFTRGGEDLAERLHTPKISASSAKLAERSREKRRQLVQELSNPVLADILVATKKAQEKQNTLKKSFRAAQELRECTFHPTISSGGLTAKNKCLLLYNLAKDIKRHNGRTKEEIEYERSKGELTFAPTIRR
eukprot:TRINITY_DN10766_c0_g1_i8.p1 TRINITY_DN10766_c0_g1~~TRINITY_DN10766_c0_g1_i8.p1  ORF type:complete len:311 (-),score=68.51 TRINITY_DN10766_c0_g1_i8:140-1072(-)